MKTCSDIENKIPLECQPNLYSEPTTEEAKHNMAVLSGSDCVCSKCGKKKPKSPVQWRTSAICKGKPLAQKGSTYLHVRVQTKQGVVEGHKTVASKLDKGIYEQMATEMYNEVVEKYGN